MSETTEKLVEEFGAEAYTQAVKFTVLAVRFGDTVGAELFAAAARELLQSSASALPTDVASEQ